VHVGVNDLLQRHNAEAQGVSGEQATALALAEGALWLARNEPMLSLMNAPRVTTRWQEWLAHKDFKVALRAMRQLAQDDLGLADALEQDSTAVAERRIKRGEFAGDLETMRAHSREYVLEEMAVFALQCRDIPAAEVYPGSNLAAAGYLVGRKLPDVLAPLSSRHFTRIDFARVSAVAPSAGVLRPKLA